MGALECEKAAQNVGILWIIVIDFVRFESFRERDHEFENLRRCWIFAPSRIKNEHFWVCFHTCDCFSLVTLSAWILSTPLSFFRLQVFKSSNKLLVGCQNSFCFFVQISVFGFFLSRKFESGEQRENIEDIYCVGEHVRVLVTNGGSFGTGAQFLLDIALSKTLMNKARLTLITEKFRSVCQLFFGAIFCFDRLLPKMNDGQDLVKRLKSIGFLMQRKLIAAVIEFEQLCAHIV